MNREAGGANLKARVCIFYQRLKRVGSSLQAPASAGDHEIVIEPGLTELDLYERFVIGSPGGRDLSPSASTNEFDAPLLYKYDPDTGHATVYPVLAHDYEAGTPVYQQLTVLHAIGGFNTPPPGAHDDQVSNDITDWLTKGPVVDNDTTRAVHRELSVEIAETEGLELQPENLVFRVYVTFFDDFEARNVIGDWQIGEFFTVQQTKVIAAEHATWQITAQDVTSKIAQIGFLNTFVAPQGAAVTGVLLDLLTMDVLPADPRLGEMTGTGIAPSGLYDAGPDLRFAHVRIPPVVDRKGNNVVMRYGAGFPVEGVSKLDAADRIAEVVNLWDFWSDSFGFAQTRKKPYFTNVLPTEDWAYETDEKSTIIDPAQLTYDSIDQRGNCCTVISEPAGTVGIRATAYNVNPDSLVSIPHLGRIVSFTVRDDLIPTPEIAEERARLEVQLRAMSDPPLTLMTAVNPINDGSHDAILVRYRNSHGQQISSGPGDLFLEEGWTMDFSVSPPVHTHRLRKIILTT